MTIFWKRLLAMVSSLMILFSLSIFIVNRAVPAVINEVVGLHLQAWFGVPVRLAGDPVIDWKQRQLRWQDRIMLGDDVVLDSLSIQMADWPLVLEQPHGVALRIDLGSLKLAYDLQGRGNNLWRLQQNLRTLQAGGDYERLPSYREVTISADSVTLQVSNSAGLADNRALAVMPVTVASTTGAGQPLPGWLDVLATELMGKADAAVREAGLLRVAEEESASVSSPAERRRAREPRPSSSESAGKRAARAVNNFLRKLTN